MDLQTIENLSGSLAHMSLIVLILMLLEWGILIFSNYIESKKEGVVFGIAKPIHKGRTTHLWEIRIVDEEDNLISICKLTNIVLDKK